MNKVKISELGDIILGTTPSTKNPENYGGNFPFVRPDDMEDSKRKIEETKKKLTEKGKENVENKVVPKDSIMFSRRGSIGYTAITTEKVVTNGGIFSINPNGNYLNKYLYYKFSSPKVQNKLKRLGQGSTHPHITKKNFLDTCIEVHDKKEQRRIVGLLDAIDSKIELNRKISSLLEETAQSIYNSWFETKSKLECENNNYITDIYGLGEFNNGASPNQNKLTNSKGIPLIKIKELKEGINNNTDFIPPSHSSNIDENLSLDYGDILFAWSATIDSFIWKQDRGFLNQHIFKVNPKDNYGKPFTYFSLKSSVSSFNNMSGGTTMEHINIDDMKQMVVVPNNSEVEVKQFNKKCEPIFNLIIEKAEENSYLEELRDYLLPRLLSGEVVVGEEFLDD